VASAPALAREAPRPPLRAPVDARRGRARHGDPLRPAPPSLGARGRLRRHLTTPAVEAFHRESSRGLAGLGWARVYLLHADGAPRAALYGFRHGRRFAFYQAGHDPEWRARSVGTVLLGHVIRHCFAEGLEEFDFLHGNEPYKLAFANGARRTVRLTASSPGLRPWLRERGRTMNGAARTVAKRLLPEGMQDWLRRRLVH